MQFFSKIGSDLLFRCNLRFKPWYAAIFSVQLQIYIIRTKLRNIRSSFFQGMLKSSFCGWLFGRSPSGRAFRCKSSLCCGLSPAIPNVGERVFTFLRLHLGARAVPSRRPFPTIPAGCMAEAGHRAEGQTEHIRPCRPKEFPGVCPAAETWPCSHILLPPVSPCLGKRAFPALRKASSSRTRQVTYHWLE